MIKYRLLRDNKESGPYSEEEMIAKGFKPYDLLWAEGKSAGWQYPSEIAPFKKYAPIVEEQPYDRFYKKQSAHSPALTEQRTASSTYQPKPAKESTALKEMAIPVQAAAPAITYNYNIQDLPTRHIHVTLPSGNTVNLTTLVARNDQRAKEIIPNNNSNSVASKEILLRNGEDQKSLSIGGTASSIPAAAPAIIATQLHESSFVKDTTQLVNERPAYRAQGSFSWSLVGAAFIGIATMVGLGIMIGLSINRERNNAAFNEIIAQRSKPLQKPVPQTAAATLPVTTTGESSTSIKQQPVKAALIQNAVIKDQAGAEASKDFRKPVEERLSIEKKDIVQHPETSLPQVRTTNSALVEKKLSLRENDFKTGAFGGISNLKFTLINASPVPVQTVQVEIDYILASKKVYKTETIFFRDIAAGAQVTIDAPASSRGIKVNSRITKVNTKDAGPSVSAPTAKS